MPHQTSVPMRVRFSETDAMGVANNGAYLAWFEVGRIEYLRELGHSYVGPEHLLIGLAEEEEGLAGDLLRRYGLTPQALRQQTVRVVGQGAEEGRVEPKSETPTRKRASKKSAAPATPAEESVPVEPAANETSEE